MRTGGRVYPEVPCSSINGFCRRGYAMTQKTALCCGKAS
ncbi:hypothetical protein RNAN_2817 [Rheinheimera nanhaiensis E407-8]|uniref:Uncharacterized protein n=1 Tax=Rheinheimera nanhaiensis E407-8 TaxID=562729 RepID=I1E0H6_9GAMM|nr:hypothetical protein RNAN_2817 [Rheinheimera nanhaiensis E407-8]